MTRSKPYGPPSPSLPGRVRRPRTLTSAGHDLTNSACRAGRIGTTRRPGDVRQDAVGRGHVSPLVAEARSDSGGATLVGDAAASSEPSPAVAGSSKPSLVEVPESNPGPSLLCQGFSERSSLCLYSAPAIT